MKRRWTNIAAKEGLIADLRAAGKTRQEIADELGLTKTQIKNWINRHNRSIGRLEAGYLPRRRGRPPKKTANTEREKDYIIKRLKMENELLRDFLRAAGRR